MIFYFKLCVIDNNYNMIIMNYCFYYYWLELFNCFFVVYIGLCRKFLKMIMLIDKEFKIDFLFQVYYCDNSIYKLVVLLVGYFFISVFKSFEKNSMVYFIYK